MKELLIKELRLAAHPLSWFFLVFALMTLIPGYPILVGSFFVCLGIFQSFQSTRETNDVLYTVLLPIEKSGAVRAKYIFVCFIQLLALFLMAVLTVLRMTLWGSAAVYVNNAMMNANLFYLACALMVFTLFNTVFVGPFFKTAYKFGKPFVAFAVTSFLLIGAAEALHHIPGLTFLNGVEKLPVQAAILVLAAAIYAGGTLLSLRAAQNSFAKLDL